MGLIPELGRSPGGGQGNPLQYSCLENPMERSLVGYSPWGCKRVRHNLATNQQQKSPACKRQVRGAACGAQSQHHRANRKAALKLRDSRLLTSTVYSFGYLNACVSCWAYCELSLQQNPHCVSIFSQNHSYSLPKWEEAKSKQQLYWYVGDGFTLYSELY